MQVKLDLSFIDSNLSTRVPIWPLCCAIQESLELDSLTAFTDFFGRRATLKISRVEIIEATSCSAGLKSKLRVIGLSRKGDVVELVDSDKGYEYYIKTGTWFQAKEEYYTMEQEFGFWVSPNLKQLTRRVWRLYDSNGKEILSS